MASRKFKMGRKLGFQQLESRHLMAGNVTAAITNHSLNLTGDNGSNQIEIEQVGANLFKVNGENGTTVNGKASQQFSVTGNISANFKAGDDQLVLQGNSSTGGYMTLPGSVNVVLGDGKNNFDMYKAYISGNLSVTGGSGADSVDLQNGAVGLGTYNGGSNDCTMNLGGGKSDIHLNYMQIERDLFINDNSSVFDLILVEGSYVGRNASIQTGSGNDNVQINEFYCKGRLNIATGAGGDQVVLGETIGGLGSKTPDPYSQKSVNVNTLTVDMGAGNDQLDLGNMNAVTATLDGNTGNDTIYYDFKTGFSYLKKHNWEHQYNYGVPVVVVNDPTSGHH
jgi:hypothetical protein